jgi:hypothetical protein
MSIESLLHSPIEEMMKTLMKFGCQTLLLIGILGGCEEKYDLSTLPKQGGSDPDTSYKQVSPAFAGFDGPQDIMVGNDQLLYVADTRANRVVMMNLAGAQLSARSILHPVSLAQDTRLDLLVGGEVVASNGDTVGALFRIHLVSTSPDSGHRLDLARIDTVWRELTRPPRRFPGITALPNNEWLAVRTGPDNSSFIDPDARVLLFNRNDVFLTPLSEFATGTGTGITNINFPTSIASFPGVKDFVLAQSSVGVAYGAIWMRYDSTSEFEGWIPKFDPANGIGRFIDFVRPNRFQEPEAVAIDRARRDVFIADAILDSVFKFNSRGTLKGESFGRYRSVDGGDTVMQQPTGLAFFNKILYVADARRGAILRFILTSDLPR